MREARVPKSDIPGLYSRLAGKYDWWAGLAEARAAKRSLEIADIQNGESVLEVAVGTGLTFVQILALNPDGRNEGIDLTEAMLARAQARAAAARSRNYRLTIGDAYALEFADSHFDVLICNYLFDLLPESGFANVLSEFARVLRSGGRLVITNMTPAESWYQNLWEWIYRISPRSFGGCRGVRLHPYVVAAGFRNVRREFVSQLTFPSEVVYGIRP